MIETHFLSFIVIGSGSDMSTVLQNWKDRMEFVKKLLTLLNSFTPPEIRQISIGKNSFTPKKNLIDIIGLGLELWCLAPLSTIFQLYRGGQFYW